MPLLVMVLKIEEESRRFAPHNETTQTDKNY